MLRINFNICAKCSKSLNGRQEFLRKLTFIPVVRKSSQVYLLRHNSENSVQPNEKLEKKTTPVSALVFSRFGDPKKYLELITLNEDFRQFTENSLLVKLLASPINPADINTMQGVYPLKPGLPGIAGNEGLFEVMKVGEKIPHDQFQPGDWVIPSRLLFGCWRTHALGSPATFMKVDKRLPLVAAATIAVNPCTAYRMLMDYVQLKENDVVIQNGANSAVGQAVIQIAHAMKVKTVNIIRARKNPDDTEKLRDDLKKLGADHVVIADGGNEQMEEIFGKRKKRRRRNMKSDLDGCGVDEDGFLERPRLALNCVGGKNCFEMMKWMGQDGVVVTYGGMSREPLTFTTSQMIFKNISSHGFWLSAWKQKLTSTGAKGSKIDSSEYGKMLSYLTRLMLDGRFQPPRHKFIPMKEFKKVLVQVQEPMRNEKLLFVPDDSPLLK